MPWEKKGPADRTLVFDTFVAVGRKDPLYVGWPDAALAAADEACLVRLVGNLSSFGRAEGWVVAEVVSFPEPTGPPVWNCVPSATAESDEELVPVFCPDPATAFGSEHYPPAADARKRKPADYLPTADGPDGRRITHVTVYAPDRFGPGQVAALTRLRSVKLGDGDPVRAQLVGLGDPADFTHWLFARSAAWESATPFVAPRHLKRRGRKRDIPPPGGTDPAAAFLRRAVEELAGRPVRVEPADGATRRRAAEYRRERSRPGDDGRQRACGLLRLVFPDPVDGPVALGYACHYGLGVFRPASAANT